MKLSFLPLAFRFTGLAAATAYFIGGAGYTLLRASAESDAPAAEPPPPQFLPSPIAVPGSDRPAEPRPPVPIGLPGIELPAAQAIPSLNDGSVNQEVANSYTRYLDAVWQQEVSGNVDLAMRSYSALVAQFDARRQRVGAEILKLGEIEHQKGNSKEACGQFGRILREFVDFRELVNAASRYMAVLGPGQIPQLPLVGIGVVLRAENGFPTVAELVPGGPAAAEGHLHVGDRVAGVAEGAGDFVRTAGMSLEKVVGLIRGPSNTVVRLQVIPAASRNPGDGRIGMIVEFKRAMLRLNEQTPQADDEQRLGLQGSIGLAATPVPGPASPEPGLPGPAPRDAKYVQLLNEEVKLLEQEIAITEREVAAGVVPESSVFALKRELLHVRQRLAGGDGGTQSVEVHPGAVRPN